MVDYIKVIFEYLDRFGAEVKFEASDFYERLNKSKYICIFGAGGLGKTIAQNFTDNNIKFDFFCDNNEQLYGKKIFGNKECISIKELKNYKDDLIIVVAASLYKEIFAELDKLGFENYYIISEHRIKFDNILSCINLELLKDRLSNVINILEDDKSKYIYVELVKNWFKSFYEYPYNYEKLEEKNQYFCEGIINLSDYECFVDVGAYDGDTIKEFLHRTNNKFQNIFAYELDKNNYDKLIENISKMPRSTKMKIFANNIGLYDENKEIRYGSNLTASVINDNADEVGKIARMSDHLKNEKVTFIKMDIEGAELKALYGAEELIKKQKPKLAICIYHDPTHFWEIPLYLKKLVPNYKIYIRHHTNLEFETVCYAVL